MPLLKFKLLKEQSFRLEFIKIKSYFKYMEEYFYDYVMTRKDEINSDRVYIPAFWTNIQILSIRVP